MNTLQKLAGPYKATALLTFNTLVLFVAVNLLLFVGNRFWRAAAGRPQPGIVAKYGLESLKQVYPGVGGEDLLQLLQESWSRPFVFEPFTQFKDAPFTGRFVNVDTNGFRHGKNQSPWPPLADNFNVFIFGGSTVFGYGVSDDQTVASFLQVKLSSVVGRRRVAVFNFGRGFYYSSQERMLFEQLLATGIKPDHAIFIDGLNEFFYANDRPRYSQELADFMSGDLKANPMGVFSNLPVLRKLNKLVRHFSSTKSPQPLMADSMVTESEPLADGTARRVCERYQRNQQLIESMAQRFGVPVCFVWQPVPTYKYDLAYHLFVKKGFREHHGSVQGYAEMAAMLANYPPAKNFIWCADMQETLKEPLYVDVVHYSGRMNEMSNRGLIGTSN